MTAPFAPLDKRLTPDEVLKRKTPAEWYECPMTANIYDIQFLAFKIRDIDSGEVYFNIDREDPHSSRPVAGPLRKPPVNAALTPGLDAEREQRLRTVHYAFPKRILDAKRIGTKLTFTVGSKAVRNFRMIELHFFRDQVVKTFDFTSQFCIPGSVNTWESIYDVPELDPAISPSICIQLLHEKAMIENPFETQADSYYFVGDTLIMHNKAMFKYE